MLNLQSVRRKPGQQTAQVVTIPAPIGGWNARDAISAMEPTDAITLDNFFPDSGGVRLRMGYTEHVSALGAVIESLMTWSGPAANPVLLAARPTSIVDVTAAGSGVSSQTGLTNGRWQHVMFATTGGNFLVICNGADSVLNFNGTSWSTPSISGVSSTSLVNVTSHVNRLWFVQDNTLDAWYLPVASISGTAVKLPLGPFCKKGGKLLAIASWTRDGGAGMDDNAVFITNKGEAVIYAGSDPSSAATWAKVGTFDIPEPVGHRCVVKIGADVGIITSQGVLPLSAILPLSSSGVAKVAATDKISGAAREAYEGSATAFGWQLIEYPKEQMLILNVPIVESVTTHQYVMNTQNGAWCRFTGMNAGCWALLGDVLYFGGHDGKIYKYGTGFADAGEEINAVSISAFTDLGSPSTKKFTQVRPMLYGPDGYSPLIALRTDYDLGEFDYSATTSISLGSFWDEEDWDDADWGLGIVPSSQWQSVLVKPGSRVSAVLSVAVTDEVRFNAYDLMFEVGGAL